MSLPAFSGRAGDLQRRPGDRATGNAGEDRLLSCQPAGRGDGVFVGHPDHFIVDLGVQQSGNEPGADALLPVRRRLAAREHRAFGRLDGHDVDARLLLPEEAAGAGDRASGADAGDEDVHLAAGVGPDLRARGAVVDGGIGGVVELARHPGRGRPGARGSPRLARSRPSSPWGLRSAPPWRPARGAGCGARGSWSRAW